MKTKQTSLLRRHGGGGRVVPDIGAQARQHDGADRPAGFVIAVNHLHHPHACTHWVVGEISRAGEVVGDATQFDHGATFGSSVP